MTYIHSLRHSPIYCDAYLPEQEIGKMTLVKPCMGAVDGSESRQSLPMNPIFLGPQISLEIPRAQQICSGFRCPLALVLYAICTRPSGGVPSSLSVSPSLPRSVTQRIDVVMYSYQEMGPKGRTEAAAERSTEQELCQFGNVQILNIC